MAGSQQAGVAKGGHAEYTHTQIHSCTCGTHRQLNSHWRQIGGVSAYVGVFHVVSGSSDECRVEWQSSMAVAHLPLCA